MPQARANKPTTELQPPPLRISRVFHAPRLQPDRVRATRDDEVVAYRDRVPALLGRPATDPLAPGAVAAEAGGDLAVI